MTRVSAEVRRDEATINDNRDNRKRELFTVVDRRRRRPRPGRPHLVPQRRSSSVRSTCAASDIRWINLGRRTSQGKTRTIAGQDSASGLFRVCASCGQLDTQRRPQQPIRTPHLVSPAGLADRRRPRHGAGAHVAHPRCAAAPSAADGVRQLRPSEPGRRDHARALRQVIGGSPEHLDVATIRDALCAPDRRALLIHDTVPGGTGYLAEFSDHAKVWSVLAAARKIVRDCPCQRRGPAGLPPLPAAVRGAATRWTRFPGDGADAARRHSRRRIGARARLRRLDRRGRREGSAAHATQRRVLPRARRSTHRSSSGSS